MSCFHFCDGDIVVGIREISEQVLSSAEMKAFASDSELKVFLSKSL